MLKTYTVADAQRTILNRGKAETVLPDSLKQSMRRIFGRDVTPAEAVAEILADVRSRGDAALRDWTFRIDGVQLDRLMIDRAEIAAAIDRLPTDLIDSLQFAADRVLRFHQYQPLPSWTTTEMGGILGQKMTPLTRVGVYVPGGTAPLPSTLLMCVIPAQVAGVKDVVVVTPPGRSTGTISDVILAAAHLAGIETIYQLGGAQAIAALAYGTTSIPRVDKIVGPGNLFVTLAKQQVFGLVGLDGLAGPTETVVIADDSANVAWVAADLIAQAEHDVLASAILFTPSTSLAEKVQIEVARQLEERSRASIIATSMQGQGGIVITRDLDEAVRLADEYAPEHMCLAVEDPARYEKMIMHAGGLFIGERSFEVLGDYVAGPSHTMPTGGTARFASPLNALDFVRITSLIALDDESSAVLSEQAARIAFAEQLDGHAQAALLRTNTHRENGGARHSEEPRSGDEESLARHLDSSLARNDTPTARNDISRESAQGGACHSEEPLGGDEESLGQQSDSSLTRNDTPTARNDTSIANLRAFIRPDIAAMKPYTPILPFEVLSKKLGRTPDQIVKLDANENPYGPSPKVREALAQAPFLHIYPDPDSTAMREALAKFTGVPIERLMAGAGADELIDLILRATIVPGDVVIDCPPSFGMYPFSSAVNAARYVAVPRHDDFTLDVDAIETAVRSESRAKVLFVCLPNNPDGSLIAEDDLRRLLKLPVLVVLDEAYIEFVHSERRLKSAALGEAGHIAWTLKYPNLVVLRTFSKWAGLAGLRVGYGAFPDWLLPQLWKIKQPYNVNVAASVAAIASLDDLPYLQAQVDRLVTERDRLWAKLNEFDFLKPYPTQSNFILCRVIDRDAKALKQALEAQGVLVRYFDRPGLQNCIRVSVGKPEQTDALIEALKTVTSDK